MHITLLLFQNLEGIQLYMELIDRDGYIVDELIDRFVINITSPELVNITSLGIFGLAEMNITTEVTCAPDFTGSFCTLVETTTTENTITKNSTTDNSTTEI